MIKRNTTALLPCIENAFVTATLLPSLEGRGRGWVGPSFRRHVAPTSRPTPNPSLSGRGALLALSALLLPTPALADGIVDNVNGVTIADGGRVIHFKAILVDKDGRVTRLVPPGEEAPKLSRKELKKNAGKPLYDWRVDMGGKTVLPGFIDAHGHVLEMGFGALSLDLSMTKSLDEAKSRIAAYIAGNPDRKWVLGRGWNQEAWGLGRFPTAADLESVSGGHPIWQIGRAHV